MSAAWEQGGQHGGLSEYLILEVEERIRTTTVIRDDAVPATDADQS